MLQGIGVAVRITIMTHEKGLGINESHMKPVTLMTWYTRKPTCITGHSQCSRFKQARCTTPTDV